MLSDNELEIELKKSKIILSKILNSKIEEFSIPYGEYNRTVIKKAKKYYSKIYISGPLIFKKKDIVGRLSIHRSNFTKVNFILSQLNNKFNILFILKIISVRLIKRFIPLKGYRKLKNLILDSKSINYFN